MPPLRSHKRRRVACQHFPDDQTLRLQAGAGEDDVIHLTSGLDRVDCDRDRVDCIYIYIYIYSPVGSPLRRPCEVVQTIYDPCVNGVKVVCGARSVSLAFVLLSVGLCWEVVYPHLSVRTRVSYRLECEILARVVAVCRLLNVSGTYLRRQLYHNEIKVADQIFYLTQSQHTDTGPTSPSADPMTPGSWHG